jgi:hypothetical protein
MKRSMLAWLFLAPCFCHSASAQDDGTLRFHDVRSLLTPLHDARAEIRPSGALSIRTPDMGAAPEEDADLRGEEDGESFPNPPLRAESFVDFLKNLILRLEAVPEIDDDAIQLAGGTLRVRGYLPLHAAVETALAYLKQQADAWASLEVLIVPLASLDALFPSWGESDGRVPAEVFEKALADPAARLLTAQARIGHRVGRGARETHAMLVDHEINQTGVIPVSNPVVQGIRGGDRVEVRPLLAVDGGAVLLDLVCGRVGVSSRNVDIGSHWSRLDLPIVHERLLATRALLEPGDVYVLGVHDGDEPAAFLGRVRLSTPSAGADAPASVSAVFRSWDISSLISARPRRWRLEAPGVPAGEPGELAAPFEGLEELAPFDGVSLQEGIFAAVDPALRDAGQIQLEWQQGKLCFFGPRAEAEKAKAFLAAESARRLRTAFLQIDAITLPREALAGILKGSEAGRPLPANWRTALDGVPEIRRRRYRLLALAGEEQVLRDASLNFLIVDSEQVSGGTGFAIIERSDPVVSSVGDGLDLHIKVDLPPQGERAFLQIRGLEVRVLDLRKVTARFPTMSAAPVPGTAGQQNIAVTDSIQRVDLSLPTESLTEWDHAIELPLGRDVLLAAEGPPEAAARLVVARVVELR